jgi:2-polyprenyl-6-hydroxyphenyl methylase/3-demethylubiquinone-9 3-methyltransferase
MAAVDDSELSKFEALAQRWWDPEGEFKPLHQIQPLRLDYIRSIVNPDGRRVLDVGSGGGLLAEGMAAAGAQVVGLEPGEATVNAARAHLDHSGLAVEYRQGTVEDVPDSETGRYDLITCLEVLEHVPDPGATIARCADLLRPGGYLFVATLNRTLRSYAFGILAAEYVLGMLPRGTHDWERFIRPSEMAAHMRRAELAPADFTGMSYNPVTRTFRLSRDLAVNYLGYARKPEGRA